MPYIEGDFVTFMPTFCGGGQPGGKVQACFAPQNGGATVSDTPARSRFPEMMQLRLRAALTPRWMSAASIVRQAILREIAPVDQSRVVP